MAGDQLWVQTSNIGPAPRCFHKMAFDSDRKVVVLFGGFAQNTFFNDTWEWDGALWTQVSNTGPAKRFAHVMCYDSIRKKTVLFGGTLAGNPNTIYGDTWEWDGTDWSQVSQDGAPARAYATMDFDSNTKRSILFGGTKISDTWAWDGNEWKQISDIGPSGRQQSNICFNSVANTLVLYGGIDAGTGNFLSDTWEWDGALWKQNSNFGPKAVIASAMAFDGKNPVLFGGQDNVLGNIGETWQWNGKYWTEIQDIGPSPRSTHAMCFDSVRSKIVLFGGSIANPGSVWLNDTWELGDD